MFSNQDGKTVERRVLQITEEQWLNKLHVEMYKRYTYVTWIGLLIPQLQEEFIWLKYCMSAHCYPETDQILVTAKVTFQQCFQASQNKFSLLYLVSLMNLWMGLCPFTSYWYSNNLNLQDYTILSKWQVMSVLIYIMRSLKQGWHFACLDCLPVTLCLWYQPM